MTKIYSVRDDNGDQRFFADRTSALEHAREEHKASDRPVEVEMLTLIKANPAVLAVKLLEGGYCAEAKTIRVYKRRL